MSDQGFVELVILNKKLDELIGKYETMTREIRNLKYENEVLKRELQVRTDKIKELETKYERVKLSGALLGGGENAIEARKTINDLVREIDRCVALLNR